MSEPLKIHKHPLRSVVSLDNSDVDEINAELARLQAIEKAAVKYWIALGDDSDRAKMNSFSRLNALLTLPYGPKTAPINQPEIDTKVIVDRIAALESNQRFLAGIAQQAVCLVAAVANDIKHECLIPNEQFPRLNSLANGIPTGEQQ